MRIDKKGEKSQKLCLTDYNSLTANGFCQAPYQILLIILLMESVELNLNTDTMIKNVKLAELNTIWDCLIECTNFNDNLIECKCLCCNKNYQKFDENLKKQFFNAYRFSSHDIIKFILLLRKGVYRYKYMNYWEKFNETSLLKKEDIF